MSAAERDHLSDPATGHEPTRRRHGPLLALAGVALAGLVGLALAAFGDDEGPTVALPPATSARPAPPPLDLPAGYAPDGDLDGPPTSDLLLPVGTRGDLAGDAALLRDAAAAWDTGTEDTYEQGRYPYGLHTGTSALFAGTVDGRETVLLQGLSAGQPHVALASRLPGEQFDRDLGLRDLFGVEVTAAQSPDDPLGPVVAFRGARQQADETRDLVVVAGPDVARVERTVVGAQEGADFVPTDGFDPLPLEDGLGRVPDLPVGPGAEFVRGVLADGTVLPAAPVRLWDPSGSGDDGHSVPGPDGPVVAEVGPDEPGGPRTLLLSPARVGDSLCLVLREPSPAGDASTCQVSVPPEPYEFEELDGLTVDGGLLGLLSFGPADDRRTVLGVLAGQAAPDVVAVDTPSGRLPVVDVVVGGRAVRLWAVFSPHGELPVGPDGSLLVTPVRE